MQLHSLRSQSTMVCSVCGGSGHNKRTCIAKKIDDSGLSDEMKGQAVDYLCNQMSDEALAEAIAMGADVIIPGLGVCLRLGRLAWKLSK